MREDTLQRKIAEYCKEKHIQGVLRVTVCGKVKYEQAIGFADIQNRVPFTSESMFTLYSLSKPFCAIGLLKLKDKGYVDLDSHPSRYVTNKKKEKTRCNIRIFSFLLLVGLGYCPRAFVHTNAMLVLTQYIILC